MDAYIDISAVRLETERLLLRPWQETDVDDLYEYASVPGVGEMAGWVHHGSREESACILSLFIQQKKTFALALKDTGKVIGSLGIEKTGNLDDSFDVLRGRELGYVLSRDYWGKGLMAEAVGAVIRYCFDQLHLDFLTCAHFVRNNQSRRVIEKCGFSFLKECKHETRYGTVEDTLLYIQYHNER